MPARFFYVIGLIVVGLLLMGWFNKRKKQTAWRGAVTGVQHQRPNRSDEQRSPEDWVTVSYRTEEGKEDRFKLRYRFYRDYYPNRLQAGELLVKRSGEFLPRREADVEAAPSAETVKT
jgi:hypothetical protein